MDILKDKTSLSEIKDYIFDLKPGFLGSLIYYLIPVRKGIILRNLDLVFGDNLSQAEKKKLCKSVYRHVLKLSIEAISLFFLSQKTLLSKTNIINGQYLVDLYQKSNRPIVMLTGHFGGFELSIKSLIKFSKYNMKFQILRRKIKSKLVTKYLFEKSNKGGIEVIEKGEARKLVSALTKNRDLIIFVFDQHTGDGDGSIPVEFFNVKAETSAMIAKIAKKYNAHVIPASSVRLSNNIHDIMIYDEIEWVKGDSESDELYKNTVNYNLALENMVRKNPDQWFCWLHRRWRFNEKA